MGDYLMIKLCQTFGDIFDFLTHHYKKKNSYDFIFNNFTTFWDTFTPTSGHTGRTTAE